LARSAGYEYALPGANLGWILDPVDTRQFVVAEIVGFADAKQVFARANHVIDALERLTRALSVLRRARSDQQKQRGQETCSCSWTA
jgi:hypothetical protein